MVCRAGLGTDQDGNFDEMCFNLRVAASVDGCEADHCVHRPGFRLPHRRVDARRARERVWVASVSWPAEPAVVSPTGPPDFLTLDEAAAVLRVGRSTAYREANAFERSGGRTGIPVVRLGKQFRVPRYRLEEQLGGPLTWPPPPPVAVEPRVVKQPTKRSSRPTQRAKRQAASRPTTQLSLGIEP